MTSQTRKTTKNPAPVVPDIAQLFPTEARGAVIAGYGGRATLADLREALPAIAKLNHKRPKYLSMGEDSFEPVLRVLGSHDTMPADGDEVDYVFGVLIAEAKAGAAVEMDAHAASHMWTMLNMRSDGRSFRKAIPLSNNNDTFGVVLVAQGPHASAKVARATTAKIDDLAEKGLVALQAGEQALYGRVVQHQKTGELGGDVSFDLLGDRDGIEDPSSYYLVVGAQT